MEGKTLAGDMRITHFSDGSERRCEGCGRSHFGINLQKRCGACFDEGRVEFLVKACESCGGAQQLDKLMREHDAIAHAPTPIYPVKPGKTVEEISKEFAELIPGSDGPMWGTPAGGKVTGG